MKKKLDDNFSTLEKKNKVLEKLINLEIKKNKKKDQIIFKQNKLVSMGEMITNITHQWRQPLMEISSLFIPIEAKLSLNNKLEKQEVREAIVKLNEITKYMSNTIDDFKNFFSKNKEKTKFKLSDQINSSVNIISSGLYANKILLEIIVKKNPVIYGYENEYTQVLINIINNAKDILIQRNTKKSKIKIVINEDENNAIVTISDNAGGIKIKAINDIFNPFFTYEKTNGSGVGLFMSKLIIENNMNGKLLVNNDKEGASFIISTPKN